MNTEPRRILQPGKNCWRIERAHRFAMLVDADAYYRAARAAMRAARHRIFILCWDIDSRMRLVPSGAHDGYPEKLGDFLHALVCERPSLHVQVLNWDFTMLYAMEREWLPTYRLGWRTHRRMVFRLDAAHPVGASHHQKVLVVDDALAFVGGLDLTSARWDTTQHRATEPVRVDAEGRSYEPFHDVQAAVDGDVARALGALCRDRWRRATGESLPELPNAAITPWPDGLLPDLTDIDVGIARTAPALLDEAAITELRQLHLDGIDAARQTLFFENQYFTAGLIAEALARRLAEPAGPEVLIISPKRQSGWLEESTMGVLRARLHARLRAADLYRRYALMCPELPGPEAICLNVHSKVFCVDERLFVIGSANLSNRSLACDTECSLCIEAHGTAADRERIALGLRQLRARLLAEHTGMSVAAVLQALQREASLLALVRQPSAGAGEGRRLGRFDPVAPPELDALIPQSALFDPEQPIDPARLLAQMLPRESREPLPRRLAGLMTLSLMMLLLVLLWRFTPLRDWLNLSAMVAIAQQLRALPFTFVLVLLAYIAGGLLMVPVTLLIAVTGIVFGVHPGTWYAIAGTLASAAAGYAVGALLGRDAVRNLLGNRINRLSFRLARRGILAMVIVRALPLAPYGMVNIIAGASHLRLRDYLIGTLLGMLPGILLTTTFAHNLMVAIRNPNQQTVGVLLIIVLLLAAIALGTRKLLRRQRHHP